MKYALQRQIVAVLALAVLLVSGVQAGTYSHRDVDRLMQSSEPPDGVVFELLSWDDNTWQWAAPMIAALRQQLRSRFANIDIVVVSHGGEQFQLVKTRVSEQPEAIAQLRSLVDDGLSLHVCGTHSAWRDVPASAYLDFADVAPSGPAQINDYIKMGYTHILLERPF